LKICVVGLEIGPSRRGSFVGGVVNNVVRLSKAMWENGHQIHIVTTPARYSKGTGYNVPWAEIHFLPVGGVYPSARYGFEFIIRAMSEIRRLHKKEKFDVIHGHSGHHAIGLAPSISGKMLDVSSVHTLYCSLEERIVEKGYFHFSSNPHLIKNLFLSVDRIVAISSNVKSSLDRVGLPREKISVIPLAIDSSSFNPTVSGKHVRMSLGISFDKPLILFVGNLTKTKGVHVLIEAMKVILRDFPAAKLLITLHVPKDRLSEETHDIKAKIDSLHLQKNITFMGITGRMPEVIAACDVLVAPFLSTAGPSDYPLPILEAMAIGKPVVATNVGGIPEIISNQHNGMLVRPNNPAHLAKTIVYLVQNQDIAKKIGRNASIFVRENFSIQKVVGMNENLYNEISNR